MTVRALGDRAIRFARPARPSPAQIVETVRGWPGVVDVVVTAQHVAAYFDREPIVDERWLDALAALPTASDATAREIELPAVYDGADLADVARATQLSIDEVCMLHANATYVVDTMGFAPGFAYLRGLPPQLVLPRRATPRAHVPAGSIAIATTFTAVYPFDSPGGWHLLGRVVGVRMFGPDGALLRLGDRVRFVPA